MTPFDIALAVLCLILLVRASLRGFVEEAFSLAALAFGVVAAALFYAKGGEFLRQKIAALASVPVLAEALAAVALFFIVFLAARLLSAALRDIVERLGLGGLNRVLGALLGLVEGLALAVVIMFLFAIQPLFDKHAVLDGSLFHRCLGARAEAVEKLVSPGK